jgi:hypothetical protein
MIYSLYTLVDITATGLHRGADKLERYQQQNFDTVIQTIGLSGNVYYEKPPQIIAADIFGVPEQRCWYFEWRMELEGLFEVDGDVLARLKDNFEYVPFITGLTESVAQKQQFFKLGSNIIFDFKQ